MQRGFCMCMGGARRKMTLNEEWKNCYPAFIHYKNHVSHYIKKHKI